MKIKNVKNKLFVLVLLICFIYVYFGNAGTVTLAVEQTKETNNAGEILQGMEVGQSFYSNFNNICGFSLKLATYMRTNKGKIEVGIKDLNNNNIVFSSEISTESIKDNDFINLRFPPIKFSKGKRYYLFVKSLDSTPGNAITTYINEEDSYSEGELYLNGIKKKGELVFKVYYNKTFI
ncbi:hypothetical protein [Paenibacillus ehimensis]|uniref:Uncharacterized protein n=1 Tax=Paenibacillus ehimensis TaxID=79264 RepID=A0ABT8VH43_9BACL|nr:hypothetical protein [Paenibacillus ehimensis]MDO3680295.1 hypothetical protein [Paenibacillus ehimensis]